MPRFVIHATGVGRAKSIHSGLFGWRLSPMPGAEDAGCHLIDGSDIGDGGVLTGGIMRRMAEAPAKVAPIRGGTMTFEVDDCDARYEWALAHGGAEALPPMDYPGIGRCAHVEDGEGNVVGMITPVGDA